MRLYLDDDSVHSALVGLLVKDGHDVRRPSDFHGVGDSDPVHLTRAIRDGRTLLSRNHDDFKALHELVITSTGHHPGIVIVRSDNDPTRDRTPRGVVHALRNLASRVPTPADRFLILNHFR
jgi:hypothetical protein